MRPSENRLKELEKLLEEAYKVRIETERLLSVTTNPTEYARLKIDLEKCVENIKRIEAELEGKPTPEERAMVQTYLSALYQEFEKFDVANLIKLRTQPGKLGPQSATTFTLPLARQRSLERFAEFIKSEKAQPGFSPVPPPSLSTPEPDKDRPEVSIEEFLVQHKRITLLGAPGSGKSTTLRRLVKVFGEYWLSSDAENKENLPEEWWGRIPIFGSLNQWQVGMSLMEFLQSQASNHGTRELAKLLPQFMNSGRVVLFFDGLNELPQLTREAKSGEINDLRAREIARLDERVEWSELGCVVSCRVKEFAGGPKWYDLHILNLTRVQVETFIEVYYEGEIKAEELKYGLIKGLYMNSKIKSEKKLASLIMQPFYLVRLLDYYQYFKTQGLSDEEALPSNPAMLISYNVNELIIREIKNGNLSERKATELKTRLSYLAFNMVDANRVGKVDKELATAWASYIRKPQEQENSSVPEVKPAEKIRINRLYLKAEGASLLIVSEDTIQFYHQLFQEYFCAYYCYSQPFNDSLLLQTSTKEFYSIWPLWAKLDPNLLSKLDNLLNNKKTNWYLRREAIKALGLIGEVTKTEVEFLSKALQSSGGNGDLIWAVLLALSRIGEAGIQPLIQTLEEPRYNGTVRKWVAEALGMLGEKAYPAVSSLIQAFIDSPHEVCEEIAHTLGKIGDPSIQPLIQSLESSDSRVRRWATFALAHFNNSQVIKAIIAALNDPDSEVRETAALALGIIKDDQALKPLINALNDRDNWVRYQVAETLGKIGNSQALDSLEQMAQRDTGETGFGKIAVAATNAIKLIKERQSLQEQN